LKRVKRLVETIVPAAIEAMAPPREWPVIWKDKK
jgi:hypothetical protein